MTIIVEAQDGEFQIKKRNTIIGQYKTKIDAMRNAVYLAKEQNDTEIIVKKGL